MITGSGADRAHRRKAILWDITTTADISIGRGPDCDICLSLDTTAIDNSQEWNTLLSRRHALLHWDGSTRHWAIEDLKSVNGVLVNGIKVKKTMLKLGDLVTFGRGSAQQDGAAFQDGLTPCKFKVVDAGVEDKAQDEYELASDRPAAGSAIAEYALALDLTGTTAPGPKFIGPPPGTVVEPIPTKNKSINGYMKVGGASQANDLETLSI